MSITRTSLIHPAMIRKIRAAMYYASKGQGHMMNGHGKRCYIANGKGHNIMRLDWIGGRQGYIVYGSESRNITRIVRNALASVVARELAPPAPTITPIEKDSQVVGYKKRMLQNALKVGSIASVAALMTSCTQITQMLHNFI